MNKGSQRLIKKLIADVSGIAVPIGPYEPETSAGRPKASAEDSMHKLEALGTRRHHRGRPRRAPFINRHGGAHTFQWRNSCHESKNARRLRPPRYEQPDASGPEDAERDMQAKQAELEQTEYTASAPGEMVTVRHERQARGAGVTIKPEAVDPDDIEMLQDLVAAAVKRRRADGGRSRLRRDGPADRAGLNIPGLGL